MPINAQKRQDVTGKKRQTTDHHSVDESGTHLNVFLRNRHETVVAPGHPFHEHLRRSSLEALHEGLVRLQERLLGPLQGLLLPHKPRQNLVQNLIRKRRHSSVRFVKLYSLYRWL